MSAEKQPLSTPEAFLLGGVAACGARLPRHACNCKGELAKNGGKRVYRNTFDVLAKTARNEGIRGVQRGLGPAYAYQGLGFDERRLDTDVATSFP
ncbi:hypothetical protein MPER_03722 [Moniliophthora perniciosa FA553]|nr:hypothetical protein MPER_03722 [Moniliophthora perniciosa FA553]